MSTAFYSSSDEYSNTLDGGVFWQLSIHLSNVIIFETVLAWTS